MESLSSFFELGDRLARPYAGQLDPKFQQMLADAHAGISEEDCHFYHTQPLGDGTVLPGGCVYARSI
jgi:hypothetical protein